MEPTIFYAGNMLVWFVKSYMAIEITSTLEYSPRFGFASSYASFTPITKDNISTLTNDLQEIASRILFNFHSHLYLQYKDQLKYHIYFNCINNSLICINDDFELRIINTFHLTYPYIKFINIPIIQPSSDVERTNVLELLLNKNEHLLAIAMLDIETLNNNK